MAKVSVRQCDSCGGLDSPECRVLRVTIIGVRREQCRNCAIGLMVLYGVDAETAAQKFESLVLARDSGRFNPTLIATEPADEPDDDASEPADDEQAAAVD